MIVIIHAKKYSTRYNLSETSTWARMSPPRMTYNTTSSRTIRQIRTSTSMTQLIVKSVIAVSV